MQLLSKGEKRYLALSSPTLPLHWESKLRNRTIKRQRILWPCLHLLYYNKKSSKEIKSIAAEVKYCKCGSPLKGKKEFWSLHAPQIFVLYWHLKYQWSFEADLQHRQQHQWYGRQKRTSIHTNSIHGRVHVTHICFCSSYLCNLILIRNQCKLLMVCDRGTMLAYP